MKLWFRTGFVLGYLCSVLTVREKALVEKKRSSAITWLLLDHKQTKQKETTHALSSLWKQLFCSLSRWIRFVDLHIERQKEGSGGRGTVWMLWYNESWSNSYSLISYCLLCLAGQTGAMSSVAFTVASLQPCVHHYSPRDKILTSLTFEWSTSCTSS